MTLPRLAAALYFLSSDAIPLFSEELLLPSTVLDTVIPAVRDALRPAVERGFIGACDENRDREISGILCRLEEAVSLESVCLCNEWADELYVVGVPDRNAEMSWTTAIYACSQDGFHSTLPERITEDISELWRRHASAYGAFKKVIDTKFPKIPSDWDSKLKPGLYSEWEDVMYQISEIATYNRFLLYWEQIFSGASPDELEAIQQWGVEALQFTGETHVNLPFAGSWRYSRRIFHLVTGGSRRSSTTP